MSWILFSILVAFTWAFVNIVDKYVLTKWVRKPAILLVIQGVVGLIAVLLIYFIQGLPRLSYINILLALIAAIFYLLMTYFYFRAAKIEEISKVVPLFYITPLFVLIFSAIFLGEIFTPIVYIGIFLLMIGAMLISSKNSFGLKFGKAFWFMILSSFSMSISLVITKYLLDFADFWSVFAYLRAGAFLALIPVFFISYREIKYTVKKHGSKVVGVVAANESLNLLAVLFGTIAASIGYITLVNALSSLQPFFVLFFAVIISIFYPRILKEEIGKSTIALKLVAIGLMFIGALLIT